MKLYAIRPFRLRGEVVCEGDPFEPNSDRHGQDLIDSGLASDTPPQDRKTPATSKASKSGGK